MKVKELIDWLNNVPQDAEVIQTYCSNYRPLELSYIRLLLTEDKKVAVLDGHYYDVMSDSPDATKPDYTTVVHINGY